MQPTSTERYRGSLPTFPLAEFFSGPLAATGIFLDRQRRVRNRFFMTLIGRWEGREGTLEERFTFLDDAGTPSHADRVWSLEVLDEHRFRGTARGSAGDLVGTAEGVADGYAMHWRYVVRQPVGDRFYNLRADDRMYRLDADHVMNHSTMQFWGLTVGQAIIEIHRLPGHDLPGPGEYPKPVFPG